ncbi:hypothetical protein AB1L30_06085 [Bremerella sp. JC817]|uniref:hypothetical protein n=1 Tax=Bremerella sp. JC817 TaxID=3231756 RepID=UPI003457E7A0
MTRCLFVLLLLLPTLAYAESPEAEPSFRPSALGITPPLLERGTDLDQYVGRLIAIRGELHDTKIPTILGIDIAVPDETLRGKECYAI